MDSHSHHRGRTGRIHTNIKLVKKKLLVNRYSKKGCMVGNSLHSFFVERRGKVGFRWACLHGVKRQESLGYDSRNFS